MAAAVIVSLVATRFAGRRQSYRRRRTPDRHSHVHAIEVAHSQQVLEGIVLEDFEMITKHASAIVGAFGR